MTGILSAEFVRQQVECGGVEFWDWRDCREESDRLSTQLLRVASRVGCSEIAINGIDTTDIRAVVALLFRSLGERRALLVFDNVDRYVDLETLAPVAGLDVLISEARRRSHTARLLFTCRPRVAFADARTLVLSLEGLAVEETTDLLAKRGIKDRDPQLISDVHSLTAGHPLWISLVATQAQRENDLTGVLASLRRTTSGIPETTRSIWQSLGDNQRAVLRTMAELDRPESEEHLLEFLPGQNANRVNRALKTSP